MFWTFPWASGGGFGFWHLGVEDIPRTTTSPEPDPGGLSVAEDVGILALSRGITPSTGAGVALRVLRSSVAGHHGLEARGDLGVHLRPDLPLSPRLGLSLRGLGGEVSTMVGVGASPLALASGRIPLEAAYGLNMDWGDAPLEQRFSLRGSWMGQLLLGAGLNHMEGEGWIPLWMLGVDVGRYSLAILRESLANNFGAVHHYRAAIRFPG